MILEKIKNQSILHNTLLISLFWGSLAGAASQGLNFVTNILTARFLNIDYGELVLYITTNSMLQTFGLVGLNIMATVIIAKELHSKNNRLSALIPNMYYIVVSLTALTSLITIFINKIELHNFQFWKTDSNLSLVLIIIWLISSTIDTLQISILSGFSAFKDLAKVSVIKGIISIVIVTLFVRIWGVKGAIAGYALSFTISLILNYFYINKNSIKHQILYIKEINYTLIKSLLAKSFPIFFAALIIIPAQWGVNYIIFSKPQGNLALAIFGIANQWMILIQFFPVQISKVVLPFLTKQTGKAYISTEKIGLYLSLTIAILLIIISIVLEKFILSLYNFEYEVSYIPFRIMLVAALFSILNMYYGQTIIANGKAWGRTIADTFVSLSLFISFLILLNYSTILSLPIAYSIAYTFGFCCILFIKKKYECEK